jgi:hypothetical protein
MGNMGVLLMTRWTTAVCFGCVISAVFSVLFSVYPACAEPLPAPVFLRDYPMIAGDQVLLFWLPSVEAVQYHIFLNGELIATVEAPPYLAALPQIPGDHRYQVSAVGPEGMESKKSEPGIITVSLLSTPKDLVIQTAGDHASILLLWRQIPESLSYQIYRAEDEGVEVLVATVSKSSYRDREVEPGVSYTYFIRGVDKTGRDGEASEKVSVAIDAAKAALRSNLAVSISDFGNGIPVVEDFHISELEGNALHNLSFLGSFDDGIWAVLPRNRLVLRLDSSGSVAAQIGAAQLDQLEWNIVPWRLATGPDDNLYLTDIRNSLLVKMDRSGNILWVTQILNPPRTETAIWQGFPPELFDLPAKPSSVLCLKDEIWVSVPRLQLIYRFDYDGQLIGYHSHYQKGQDRWRLRQVGEMVELEVGLCLLTFPLGRKVVSVDSRFQVQSEISGDTPIALKGFLTVQGVYPMPGGQVLMTDSIQGLIRVFDPTDGQYVNHFRHLSSDKWLRLNSPRMSVLDKQNRIWVYEAGLGKITVFRINSEVVRCKNPSRAMKAGGVCG